MKVRAAIKRICGYCQIIRRGKNLYVRCQVNKRHKQRQGYHTLDRRFKSGDKNFCECPGSFNIMGFEIETNVHVNSDKLKQENSHKCCNHKEHKEDPLAFLDSFKNKLI